MDTLRKLMEITLVPTGEKQSKRKYEKLWSKMRNFIVQ